jgi:hypothetical protein
MAIRMTHPESGGTYDAQPSQVPHLQETGWQVAPGQTEQGEVWPAEVQRFEGQPPVRMRHPQVADEITVAESARPHHAAQGWLVIDAEPAAEPESEPKPTRRRRNQQQEEQAPAEAGQTTKEA